MPADEQPTLGEEIIAWIESECRVPEGISPRYRIRGRDTAYDAVFRQRLRADCSSIAVAELERLNGKIVGQSHFRATNSPDLTYCDVCWHFSCAHRVGVKTCRLGPRLTAGAARSRWSLLRRSGIAGSDRTFRHPWG